ncbi:MAG TPA: hypothetical protein PLA15_03205 [bacterium]|nr:hypothetical protein [bacterium]
MRSINIEDLNHKYGYDSKSTKPVKGFDSIEYSMYRTRLIGHVDGGIFNEVNGLYSQKRFWAYLTKVLKPNAQRIAFFKDLMKGIPNGTALKSQFDSAFKNFWKSLRQEEIEIELQGDTISLPSYLNLLLFDEFKKTYYHRVFSLIVENTVFFDLKIKPSKEAGKVLSELAKSLANEIKRGLSLELEGFFGYQIRLAKIAVGDPQQIKREFEKLMRYNQKVKVYCEEKHFPKGVLLPIEVRYNLVKHLKKVTYPSSEFSSKGQGAKDMILINKILNELGYTTKRRSHS